MNLKAFHKLRFKILFLGITSHKTTTFRYLTQANLKTHWFREKHPKKVTKRNKNLGSFLCISCWVTFNLIHSLQRTVFWQKPCVKPIRKFSIVMSFETSRLKLTQKYCFECMKKFLKFSPFVTKTSKTPMAKHYKKYHNHTSMKSKNLLFP